MYKTKRALLIVPWARGVQPVEAATVAEGKREVQNGERYSEKKASFDFIEEHTEEQPLQCEGKPEK